MVSNPSLIYYACVSKESTILAEFNSKDADLGTLATKCLEKTPSLHTFFSHTIRNKTYTFLIDNPFVYFTIHHENLQSSEGLAFLNSLKNEFNQIIDSDRDRVNNFNSHCFQGEFNPVIHQLLASNPKWEESTRSLESPRGRRIGLMVPLIGENVGKSLMKKKKKKRLSVDNNGDFSRGVMLSENKVDDSEDGIGLSRDSSLSMQKNSLYTMDVVGGGNQKAKRVWKKQVWVVLLLDLIVCSILFGVWLWVCRGFKCIDG